MNITRKRISDLMHEHRTTQVGLSEAIGITQATLSRNLNETNTMRVDVLSKISKYFNVSTDYLIGFSDHRKHTTIIQSPIGNSPHKNTEEYQNLIKLIDLLDRDQLILTTGMVMALVGKVVDRDKDRKIG